MLSTANHGQVKAMEARIPGMRKRKHVEANCAASDGRALPTILMQALRPHRWDRTPTSWSQ